MDDDADLLISPGFSMAKMDAETQKLVRKYEDAGKRAAKTFDDAQAKVSQDEKLKATAREIDRLAKRYDPAYRAAKQYEKGVKDLDRAIKVGAISQKVYDERLKDLVQRLEAGERASGRFAAATHKSTGFMQQHGWRVQQGALQMGDFMVQVGAGTSAMQAFGQQAPQFLGIFGAAGAIAGVAAAAVPPLTSALWEQLGSAETLEDQLSMLAEATDAYAEAAERASTPIDDLRVKYADLADEVQRSADAQLAVTATLARASLRGAAASLSQALGPNVVPNAELFSHEYDISLRALSKHDGLGATEAQASSLLKVLNDLQSAKGPEDVVEDAERLLSLLRAIIGDDPKKLKRYEALFESVFATIEEGRRQIEAGISSEEKRVNQLFDTYIERTRKIAELTQDRALAEEEYSKAQKSGDLDRIRSARQVLSGIDEEIKALTDVNSRIEDLQAGAEILNKHLRAVAFDEDDQMLSSVRDFRAELVDAISSVDDLDDADLSNLEERFYILREMAADFIRSIGDVDGALTVAERQSYEQYYSSRTDGARRTREAISSSTIDTIKEFEGYRARPYWDVNAYRAGFGSDTVTRADGSIQKVEPGMSVSYEDANRDLRRRVSEFQDVVIGQIGRTRWEGFSDPQRASLTSIAYNYGSLPGRILPAVRGGQDQDIATAIARLQGDNDGINKSRRLKEASAFGNTSLVQLEIRQASARQKELEKEARERKKLLDVRSDYAALLKSQVSDAELEGQLVGKSTAEQARLRAEYLLTQDAKRRGIDLNERVAGSEETYAQAIKRTAGELANQAVAQEALRSRQEEAEKGLRVMEQAQADLRNGLVDAILEGENFADVLGNVAKMLARAALEAALFGQAGLFSGASGSGGSGGILGGLTGLLFGSSAPAAAPVALPSVAPFKIPSLNGGGTTRSGPRAGGLDGKGGFLSLIHPDETILDHTKGQGAVTSVVIHNAPPGNHQVRQTGDGGIEVHLEDKIVSTMTGPKGQRAMKNAFGIRPVTQGG